LVAPALVAVGAVDAGTAVQIRADLELAVAGRQPGQENQARLMRGFSGRAGTTVALDQALSTGHARPAPHRASWRAVPVGQVIHFLDGDVRHELLVMAYLRSAGGARFIMAGWPFRRLTAADDRGVRYQIGYHGGPGVAEFLLTPDPPRQIRWLDLITAPGEPATRVDLDPPIPAPDVTMTPNAHSPGELLLDVIAARILCSGPSFPQDELEHPPADAADLRAFIGDGPGEIVAALHASGALPPTSPVPGQLARLCDRIGIPGHGITAPPADLPEPWHSMLTRPRPPPRAAGQAPARQTGPDRGRPARAGRRPDHDPRPAPRPARPGAHHRAHAGERRHGGGRLDVRQGSPATAGPVGSRQQRPLARHCHRFHDAIGEQRRGRAVA
jgi:hypothetical protein